MVTELFHHMEVLKLRTRNQMLQKKRAFDVTARTMANRDEASAGNHLQHLRMYVLCMYVFT